MLDYVAYVDQQISTVFQLRVTVVSTEQCCLVLFRNRLLNTRSRFQTSGFSPEATTVLVLALLCQDDGVTTRHNKELYITFMRYAPD